jgi:hypothetical protein
MQVLDIPWYDCLASTCWLTLRRLLSSLVQEIATPSVCRFPMMESSCIDVIKFETIVFPHISDWGTDDVRLVSS